MRLCIQKDEETGARELVNGSSRTDLVAKELKIL